MTGRTIIPIPQSSLGVVELDSQGNPTGRITVAREWYRFFGLIQGALGGSTNVFADINEQLPPPEQLIGDTLTLIMSAILDASGQAIAARGIAEDLQRRIADLESHQRGREEFPFDRLSSLEMLIPGPSA